MLYAFTTISVLLSLFFNLFNWQKAVHRIIKLWSKGSFILIGKLYRIEGKENFDKNKKYILIANHSSLFDIMAIMSIYPDVSWFGREYLINVPIFGRFLKTINYIPMKTSDIRNTKKMVERLISQTKNNTLAIFPEGTRTIDGELNKFRKGFLYVLKATELDILPVTLRGFYDFKPKSRFYFDYTSKLSALIHPPIRYSEIKNLDNQEIIDIVKETIDSALPK